MLVKNTRKIIQRIRSEFNESVNGPINQHNRIVTSGIRDYIQVFSIQKHLVSKIIKITFPIKFMTEKTNGSINNIELQTRIENNFGVTVSESTITKYRRCIIGVLF